MGREDLKVFGTISSCENVGIVLCLLSLFFFFPMSPASHPLFLVSQFSQMIQDPVSFLLSTEWFRMTLENLLWHYFIFKSTTPLDPCHNENHPALNPPNTHPATNFRAKNTSSHHDSPLFSIRSPPNNPCLLSHFFLTFPIPDFGLFTALYKPPKIKCNPETAASKNKVKQSGVISNVFLQIWSMTPLNLLIKVAVIVQYIYHPMNLSFGSKSSKASWTITMEVISH